MACFFITNKSARDVVLNYLLNCRHIQLYPLGSSPLEFPYELPDRIDSFQNSDAELVSPPKMESPAGFELSQHGGFRYTGASARNQCTKGPTLKIKLKIISQILRGESGGVNITVDFENWPDGRSGESCMSQSSSSSSVIQSVVSSISIKFCWWELLSVLCGETTIMNQSYNHFFVVKTVIMSHYQYLHQLFATKDPCCCHHHHLYHHPLSYSQTKELFAETKWIHLFLFFLFHSHH